MTGAEAKDCGSSEKAGHTCRRVVVAEMGRRVRQGGDFRGCMEKYLGLFAGGPDKISLWRGLQVGGPVAWSWEESQGERQPTSEVSSQS